MTSLPSSAGGPYGLRDIRSLYPAVTENHLRYLEKWGLVRQSNRPRDLREYSFADLLTIKQVAAELERGTPLGWSCARCSPNARGSSNWTSPALTPQPTHRAQRSSASTRTSPPSRDTPPPLSAAAAPYPPRDPQAALAAKYFLEGSRLDDGDERNMEEAAAAYRRALIIDPDLVPAIVNLANIHYARDELIEAQALYERAIGLEPDCFEAHFNLGNIQHDLGRYDRRARLLPRRGGAQSRLRRTRTSISR